MMHLSRFSAEPIPRMKEKFCHPVKVFEFPRIIAAVAICVLIVGTAEYMRVQTADYARRELSTEGRLLLSLSDTNTGLMDVRTSSNEIAYASKEACAILGYGEQELASHSINDILPENFRAFHEQKLRAAMSDVALLTRLGPSFMECTAIRKDGSSIRVCVQVFVSRNGVIALINNKDNVRHIAMPENAR